MTQPNEEKGRSLQQAKQASQDVAGKGKAPESEGFDKKLDGPNRPATY